MRLTPLMEEQRQYQILGDTPNSFLNFGQTGGHLRVRRIKVGGDVARVAGLQPPGHNVRPGNACEPVLEGMECGSPRLSPNQRD